MSAYPAIADLREGDEIPSRGERQKSPKAALANIDWEASCGSMNLSCVVTRSMNLKRLKEEARTVRCQGFFHS